MAKIIIRYSDGTFATEDPDADARRISAWDNIELQGALRTITPEEAWGYIDEQVTANATLEDAQALVSNASSLDDVKVILSALVNIVFAIANILKLMASVIIALRDYVKPDVVDE
jgi:hypothetical protein